MRSSAMRFTSAWSARCVITCMRSANAAVVAAGLLLLLFTSDAAAQRRVIFRAEDGAQLTAAYYEPAHRPAPAIVLLHMLKRSHADWDAAATELSSAGFAVMALDY